MTDSQPLSIDIVNPGVIKAEYAIRGPVDTLAQSIAHDLANGSRDYSYQNLVAANVGNPHALGQQPITFHRQVLSLLQYPVLLDAQLPESLFPSDVIARARDLLDVFGGSIGSYSPNAGRRAIRERIADFIGKQDGVPTEWENVVMTSGANEGIALVLTLLDGAHMRNGKPLGFLLPTPYYSAYRAVLVTRDMVPVPYNLVEKIHDQDAGWRLPPKEEIVDQIRQQRAAGVDTRCIVVISPSNPTGCVHTEEELRTIVEIAAEEGLFILADEVYRQNIFGPSKYTSCRSVALAVQAERRASDPRYEQVAVISLHSASKGMAGECGQRGAWMHMSDVPADVRAELLKLVTYSVNPNSSGQALMEMIAHPPQPGEPSYDLYRREFDEIAATIESRITALHQTFARMPLVSCAPAQGGMYLFGSVKMTSRALKAATAAGEAPDAWWCKKLLREAGVAVVPGAGFGMDDGSAGRAYFRITALSGGTDWQGRMLTFQEEFARTYGEGGGSA
jgi:alanine transaminase